MLTPSPNNYTHLFRGRFIYINTFKKYKTKNNLESISKYVLKIDCDMYNTVARQPENMFNKQKLANN